MNSEDPEEIQGFDIDDFEEEFIQGIRKDQEVLGKLVEDWKYVNYDPKYEVFKKVLSEKLFDEKINDNGKLIVFSESKESSQLPGKTFRG